jgi:hypothetical protein
MSTATASCCSRPDARYVPGRRGVVAWFSGAAVRQCLIEFAVAHGVSDTCCAAEESSDLWIGEVGRYFESSVCRGWRNCFG